MQNFWSHSSCFDRKPTYALLLATTALKHILLTMHGQVRESTVFFEHTGSTHAKPDLEAFTGFICCPLLLGKGC